MCIRDRCKDDDKELSRLERIRKIVAARDVSLLIDNKMQDPDNIDFEENHNGLEGYIHLGYNFITQQKHICSKLVFERLKPG